MRSLTIPDLPETLHARLAARAAAHGRSVADEALAALDHALGADAALERILRRRARLAPLPDALDPARVVRQEREAADRPDRE